MASIWRQNFVFSRWNFDGTSSECCSETLRFIVRWRRGTDLLGSLESDKTVLQKSTGVCKDFHGSSFFILSVNFQEKGKKSSVAAQWCGAIWGVLPVIVMEFWKDFRRSPWYLPCTYHVKMSAVRPHLTRIKKKKNALWCQFPPLEILTTTWLKAPTEILC